jgi:hypothetical protein
MKRVWLFAAGALCGIVAMGIPRAMMHLQAALRAQRGRSSSGAERVHTEERFAFTANAPMEKVAPLFGADKERVWAPNWNPQFIHPLPASDGQGMVFTVAHDHLKATWVNTEFDQEKGRIQYVYMIPEAMVTVITLRLTQQDNKTRVDAEYQRTALGAEADAHVRHMGEGDRNSGPDWERRVNGYLREVRTQ